jgi:hypothetical protein
MSSSLLISWLRYTKERRLKAVEGGSGVLNSVVMLQGKNFGSLHFLNL